MGAEDVGGRLALVAPFCEHHDHVPPGPHVVDVMLQVRVLVGKGPYQRALELGQEGVVGDGAVGAFEILFAVQNLDVFLREPDLKQGLDRRGGVLRVDNRAYHTIGRIRDEGVRLEHRRPPRAGIIHDLARRASATGPSA